MFRQNWKRQLSFASCLPLIKAAPQDTDSVNTLILYCQQEKLCSSHCPKCQCCSFFTQKHTRCQSPLRAAKDPYVHTVSITTDSEAGALWCDSSRGTANRYTGSVMSIYICLCTQRHTGRDGSCNNTNAVRKKILSGLNQPVWIILWVRVTS